MASTLRLHASPLLSTDTATAELIIGHVFAANGQFGRKNRMDDLSAPGERHVERMITMLKSSPSQRLEGHEYNAAFRR